MGPIECRVVRRDERRRESGDGIRGPPNLTRYLGTCDCDEEDGDGRGEEGGDEARKADGGGPLDAARGKGKGKDGLDFPLREDDEARGMVGFGAESFRLRSKSNEISLKTVFEISSRTEAALLGGVEDDGFRIGWDPETVEGDLGCGA